MNRTLLVYKVEKLDKRLPNTAGLDFDLDSWWKQQTEVFKYPTTKDYIVFTDFEPVGSVLYDGTSGRAIKILALATSFEEVE